MAQFYEFVAILVIVIMGALLGASRKWNVGHNNQPKSAPQDWGGHFYGDCTTSKIHIGQDDNVCMKFREIHFENFGPIKTGTIKQNKVNVFFGPNNSGKSLTSRLIHGINSTPLPSELKHSSLIRKYQQSEKPDMNNMYLHAILRKLGIPTFDIVTYGKNKCSIHIKRRGKPLEFTIGKGGLNKKQSVMSRILHFGLQEFTNTYDSVYIPAGRTGTIQFFTNIARIRSQLLNDLLHAFGTGTSLMPDKITTKDIKKFTRSVSSMPDYLEQFYNLILASQAEGLDTNIQKLFSNLFPGGVKSSKSHWDIHRLFYEDPTGFVTKLESAGSGAVSAFPIIAGMHYVEQNGTLIIEEPEAHLEPSKQLRLLEILQDISYDKNVNLIFTTHSDYIVKKLLALVNKRKIKHSDLNLYYFNRPDGNDTVTTIKHIEVSENGDAEQPIFDEAIDDLINEFSS